MTQDGQLLVVLFFLLAVVLLALLPLALWIANLIAIGAMVLFAYAGQQGFIGIAIFIACWVFMFPVMLVLSGIIALLNQSAD